MILWHKDPRTTAEIYSHQIAGRDDSKDLGCVPEAEFGRPRRRESAMTVEEEIADAVLGFLADQTYGNEPVLHAVIACDYVSRQRMIAALKPVIRDAFQRQSLDEKEGEKVQ